MKNTIPLIYKSAGFIALIVLFFTMVQFTSCNNESIRIFVAKTGNDTYGTGSFEQPFATLERARNEIRKLKENHKKISFEVNLREGTYYISKSFELTQEDSGSKAFPLTYTAYQKEKVKIHGGIQIDLDKAIPVKDSTTFERFSKQVRSKIKEIDLKKLNITDYGKLRPIGFARPFGPVWAELFVNGQPMSLARWPNDSTLAMGKIIDPGSIPRNGDFSNRGGEFEYDSERPLSWKSTEDIWVSGYFKEGWAEDAVELKEIDTKNKTITTKQPSLYGFGSGRNFQRWFVYNVLEEIDKPGEYYIDRKNGIMYFYPSSQIKSLEISMLERPMFSMIKASNIQIKNLVFECSRGMGVYMEQTENNIVDSCTFTNLGIVGVCMGRGIAPFDTLKHEGKGKPASEVIGSYLQHIYEDPLFNREGGHNNGIVNCTIYNTGAGGIHLSGGDRVTLEHGNNYVENTTIHDFNRIEKSYRAGIDISGVGNRISNCELYNAPSMAILLHGNDHLIEYNEIHHVCQEVHDQGALYYGRDPSERGHKVQYNFFHHLDSKHATSAVYHDDGACGMEVFGNIFYKAGSLPVLIGGGMDNPYTNNIFIGGDLAVHVDNRLQNWSKSSLDKGGVYDKRLQAVNYKNTPYSTEYPNLPNYWKDNPALPKRNPFSKNVFYKVKKIYTGKDEWMPFLDDNWVTDENPGFVNEEIMNFSLKKDAKAFEKIHGFEAIQFDKIGVLTNQK